MEWTEMKIFGLACLAAVNPKLLAVDLILMGNRRPRPMFACFLVGGMGLALTIGLRLGSDDARRSTPAEYVRLTP
jgi:hypothetical protein